MASFFRPAAFLLLLNLGSVSCQSSTVDEAVAADLNSTNPAVASQAQKVQELVGQIRQQEAVIESEKAKLAALQQQLAGAQQTLEGVKNQAQATP